MKNAAMFSFMENHPGSVIPSQRIARFVAERMRLPVFWDDPKIGEQRLDVLVIVNGAYAFSECLAPLGEAVRNAQRIVWIQNDYTIVPPIADGKATSPFRHAFVERRERGLPHLEFWTTCEKWASRSPLSTYVNWNALTWAPIPVSTMASRRRTAGDDVLYYGSFRHVPDNGRMTRLRYFDRYLGTRRVPVTISSPGRAANPNQKFVDRYPHATHVGKFRGSLVDELSRHGSGLYMEDVASSHEFHSPANRLYEMASAGLPMMFLPESVPMLARASMDVGDWAVSGEAEMAALHARRGEVWRAQNRMMMGVDHTGLMLDQFADALRKLEDALG